MRHDRTCSQVSTKDVVRRCHLLGVSHDEYSAQLDSASHVFTLRALFVGINKEDYYECITNWNKCMLKMQMCSLHSMAEDCLFKSLSNKPRRKGEKVMHAWRYSEIIYCGLNLMADAFYFIDISRCNISIPEKQCQLARSPNKMEVLRYARRFNNDLLYHQNSHIFSRSG